MRKEYKQMMDQLSPREELVEQVLAQAGAHAEQKQNRRRPMHKKKLILALAAALVVLTGSAMAVGSQLGLLNVFFQGDTSGLEPYVQTDLGSAENEDFRFTVNSAYYDGMTVYATVTWEGLNDAAVDDIMHSRSDGEFHREIWGDEMAEHLMESGGTGPDTIMSNQEEVTEAAGYRYTGGGLGGKDLPSTDTSRSRTVEVSFQRWLGPVDTPLELWVGFMGREYSVKIPLDTVVGSAHLEPDQEFLFNPLTGQRAILTEATLTPTQIYYEIETVGEMRLETGWDVMNGQFVLKMKDGTLITTEQLHGNAGGGKYDWDNGIFAYNVELNKVRFSDVSEVEAIIFGDMEFPLDGSEPTPADEEERLIPFFVPRYQFNDGSFYTEVEALCRGLGAEYTWDAETQTATATYRDVTVEMTVGSSQVLVNGEPMELTDEMWDEERQELVEVPMPVRMENGKLVAPTYLFSVSRTTGGVWDIGISYIHIGDTMEQDPDRLVVLA